MGICWRLCGNPLPTTFKIFSHDGHSEVYPECTHSPLDEDERDKKLVRVMTLFFFVPFCGFASKDITFKLLLFFFPSI